MIHNIVLMAKSKKRRGYCVAGIDSETGDWVRLNVEGRESVPRYMLRFADGTEPNLLDVITVDVQEKDETEEFQPENYFCSFDVLEQSSIDYFSIVNGRLAEDKRIRSKIFYNNTNSVDCEWLRGSEEDYYSLMIAEPTNLRFFETDTGKINASFDYKGESYRGIRVTDLEFEAEWRTSGRNTFYDPDGRYLLVLSIGLPFSHEDTPEEEKCWKLVASVIEKTKVSKPYSCGPDGLVGIRVRHKNLDEGTIVKYKQKKDRAYIYVKFDWMNEGDKEAAFAYPDSINKNLFIVNDDAESEDVGITSEEPHEEPLPLTYNGSELEALKLLKRIFGYDSFKDGQERAILSIMNRRDTLAVMPTGAGKSICYQIPALMMEGVTIVVSPLIALMQDQVYSLRDTGVPATFINSSLSNQEIDEIMYYAVRGKYKLLYVAPERLENPVFMRAVKYMKISMVAVDEAHCISQWGQDFRPSYLKITQFISKLPERPRVAAFTATATEEVKNDIICILNLKAPDIVVTGFDRPNLFYRVEQIKDKDIFIDKYLKKHNGESGIIYCATRKNVDNLHEYLTDRGFPVTKYHAGIDNETRKNNQNDFIYERSNIIVATNAFGMGIDKSNVRFVIHYNMPQSMENYYQEAGRAGRDSAPAECLLLYSPQDLVINKFILDKKEFPDLDLDEAQFARMRDRKRLHDMEVYCTSGECLRNYIRRYFGEEVYEPCGDCGNCQKDFKELDMTSEAKTVVNCVWETRGRYGSGIIAGTLKGARRARLREIGAEKYKTFGSLSNYPEEIIKKLILKMIEKGYLIRTNDQYQLIQLGNIEPLKSGSTRVVLKILQTPIIETKPKKTLIKYTDNLTSSGYKLLDKLKQIRTDLAREASLPPYVIFADKTLIEMCIHLPKTEAEFLQISGVGENKLEKYGGVFIPVIREFAENQSVIKTTTSEGTKKEEPDSAYKKSKKEKPLAAGSPWTKEEDTQLRSEYESGVKVSEIAKNHSRTYGAIRARLKKFGLLD